MTTNITTDADFFNPVPTMPEGFAACRYSRPPSLAPLDLAALVLRRRHRLPYRRAILVANLAGFGSAVAS